MPIQLDFGDNPKKKKNPLPEVHDPKTLQLFFQSQAEENKAKALGAHKKKGGPSIFSRTMDVLSRPLFTSAEATRSALKQGGRKGVLGSLEDAAVGAGRGFAGTKKTTYSKVLAEHGVKNKWAVGLGGLALDIALDPTTYIGTGVIKGATEAEKVGTTSKVVGDALKAARESGELDKAATTARAAYYTDAIKGGALGKDATKLSKEAKKVGELAKVQEGERIAAEVTKSLPPDTPSKILLKFMGKPVAESEKMHQVLSAPARALGKTELGGSLGTMFSNRKALGPLAEARKVFQGRSIAEYEDWVRKFGWDSLPLTHEEAKAFSHAYEHGLIDSLPATSKHGVDYGELADKVKEANHDLFVHDTHAFTKDPNTPVGLMKHDTPELENYLHHQYSGPGGESFKAQREKAIASDIFKPAADRKIPTLMDAKAKGLKPEEDIRVIMMNRAAKSFTGTARGNYVMDAVDRFGMALDKETAKMMKKQGHDIVNLKDFLSGSMNKGEAEKMLSFLPDNIHMDKEITKYLGAADRVYRSPEEFKAWVNLFDKVQNKWKSAATVYNPGHHVRNLSTDVFLNFLDGTVSARPYAQAERILFGGEKALGRSTKIGNQLVDNVDLLREFRESGAAPGWMMTNIDEGGRVFHGKITKALHEMSGKREEFGRLSHWLDALKKEAKGKDLTNLDHLKEASLAAANRVRKWNIDYTDLTPFERSFMKRAVPFYTWMRHSTPLMIEAALTRPGRVAVVPKSLNALEQVLGVDANDKLPVNIIPKWLREAGALQVGTMGQNPEFFAPPLPLADVAKLGEGGTKGVIGNLASQVTPFVRAPFELGTGRTMYGGGVPIKSTKDYLLNQVPISRNLSAINTMQGDPEKSDTWTRVLNYLTGSGLYEATPNRIKGELHRQLDQSQSAVKKAREKYRR